MTTEIQYSKRLQTNSFDANDRSNSLALPKILVDPGRLGSSNPLSDQDSFSISTDKDKREQRFFPCFDGTKASSEYPLVNDGQLPWDQDLLLDMPLKTRQNLQLDNFRARLNEYLERLKETNDKAFGFADTIKGSKRPKYEVMFFQKKQNQIKQQLRLEIEDYEATMAKLKVEIDKKIEKYQINAQRRNSNSSQFSSISN